MTTPTTAVPTGDLAGLTDRALTSYRKIRADKSKTVQSYQLVKAAAMARDLQRGERIDVRDREWLRAIFADEPPQGPARALWSEIKAPEALALFDYMRASGYL